MEKGVVAGMMKLGKTGSMGVMLSIFVGCASFFSLQSLPVGSESAVSVQAFTTFPAADNDNAMIGFAAFENGFSLEDNTTTCTFDSFFPVSGGIFLNGGKLFLKKDMIVSSMSNFETLGYIYGNCYSLEMGTSCDTLCIASQLQEETCPTSLTLTASRELDRDVCDVSWSWDDLYVAAATEKSDGDEELKVFRFDGDDLALYAIKEIDEHVYSIDFHPSEYALAVASMDILGESGDDVIVYSFNPGAGTLTKIAGALLGSGWFALGVAWDSDGSHLAVTAKKSSNQARLLVYSYNGSSLTLQADHTISSQTVVQKDSLTWDPTGMYIAVGLEKDASGSSSTNQSNNEKEIKVYKFTGSSLLLKDTENTNLTTTSLDWCSTDKGSFLAAGFKAWGHDLVRVYRFNAAHEIITEETSARDGENKTVWDVHWSSDCSCLLLGLNYDAASQVKTYRFNDVGVSLNSPATVVNYKSQYSARWSHSGDFIATGASNDHINIYVVDKTDGGSSAGSDKLFLSNVTLLLKSDALVKTPICVEGEVILRGCGNKVILDVGSELIIRPDSRLTIENVQVLNVGDSNIRGLADSSALTLRNSKLSLSRNYTFSIGSILYDCDVQVTGTNKFVYTSNSTSTIASKSLLFMDGGLTFSYAPNRPSKDLLYMADDRSIWMLDCASVHVTYTGLRLQTGGLYLDNSVSFSSEARNSGEAIEFDPELDIKVLGGSTVDLFGQVKYC